MSEHFDAGWLAIREPIDHRSRAAELLVPLRAWWAARGATRVLDLGCGTGSNLRYLAPELPVPQRWTLVDHDAALLARVSAPGEGTTVRTLRGDLAAEGLAEVGGSELVTASALLDLVSEPWLVALADACAAAGAAALFALSYDGGIEGSGALADVADAGAPSRAGLALVREALNAHQVRDKGLGPALGPAAARRAEALFRARGYRTWLVPSPWRLARTDAELALALVDGWIEAAAEQRPDREAEIRAWGVRARAAVRPAPGHDDDEVVLTVGHLDLVALPADQAGRRATPRA